MLTFDDQNTIRNAIAKRVNGESGMLCHRFDDIGIRLKYAPRRALRDTKVPIGIQIQVKIYVQPIPGLKTGEILGLTSAITAPLEFDHATLLNEIDEVIEGCKAARREHLGKTHSILSTKAQMAGNG